MPGKVRSKNNLNQMLPIITVDPVTKRQIQSMLPPKGVREFAPEELSPQVRSLARSRTIEISES